MSRALVLGGGGPVGIGWESGLIVGLAQAGIDLSIADLLIGTSAGSVVGAQLALGLPAAEAPGLVGAAGTAAGGSGADMDALFAAMAESVTSGLSPEAGRQILGRIAVESPTGDEEAWVGLFDRLAGVPWPSSFACTAVDVETGVLQVWDAKVGVPLDHAVASSCAVPGIFPPVTLQGHRYMDGGMRTALNADLAAGQDQVVVVSCFPLRLPEGMSDPMFDAMATATDAELTAVRDRGGRLETIVPNPEFLELSGWGLKLMDYALTAEAFAVGTRQAVDEAARIAAVWA